MSLPEKLPEVLRRVPYDTVYTESEVNRPPKVKDGMETIVERLDYPAEIAPSSVDSRIVVQLVVSPEGRATNVQLIDAGYPPLEREALRTVLTSTFVPGRRGGTTVPALISVPITFGVTPP